jgi:phenylacetate-CoA ligase
MPIVDLETRLHNTLRAHGLDASSSSHPEINWPVRITRADFDRYRLSHLQQTLRYVYKNSSFYREHFQKAGVEPDDVTGLADLSKLPFTESHHIAEEPYRFLCLSRASIASITTFITSGTTGPQKKIFWTKGDLERIVRFMAAGIGTVADRTDVVQICLPGGRPFSQADLLARGVESIGALPIVADASLSSREQMSLLEKHHSTILFGYTPHMMRLTRELQANYDLRSKEIKVLFLASEYLPGGMRQELQRLWNCRVYTHYGLTEMGLGVAIECSAGHGYHFNEADLLLEIIDPQTGAPVAEGQEGELVFTTLNREAMPLIRYRTGDISRWIPEPCSCGATTLSKFDAVRKRRSTIRTLTNGDEIYPTLFDDLLYKIPGLIDYQVILFKEEYERLDFRIELVSKSENSIPEIKKLLLSSPIISRNLATQTIDALHIEIVEPGALKTISRTKKMIVDRR